MEAIEESVVDERASAERSDHLYRWALVLSVATILYNVCEGVISMWFGVQDETLTLLGFGIDSFIEVVSGVGILHLVARMMTQGLERRGAFEATALRVTGTAFYILVTGLVTMAIYNAFVGHAPQISVASMLVAGASIATMWMLMAAKLRVGRRLQSAAIIADASCTKTCIYMSVILLLAALLYAWTSVPYLDSAGALGLAYFSWKEGRECFAKARDQDLCCASC